MSSLWKKIEWCNKMQIKYDFNNMMGKFVLNNNYSVNEDSIHMMIKPVFNIVSNLRCNPKGFMKLPYDMEQIIQIKDYHKKIKGKFDNILIIGIGGSSLGAKTLISALKPFYSSESPRIFFIDNVDPEQLTDLLNAINLKKTLINVITKSGNTVETMSIFLIIKDKLKKILGAKYSSNIVVTTDEKNGELRHMAEDEKFHSFAIPVNVGGRFSVLSPVGLLPAELAGIDIESLLAGARAMNKICMNDSLWENPAAMSAILQYLFYSYKKMNMVVLMPYSSKLKNLAEWFKQLWAESLGKKYSNDGDMIFAGSTPIDALGVTDQHSQLQLYTEGPYDKTIIFIKVEKFTSEIKIPKEKKIRIRIFRRSYIK